MATLGELPPQRSTGPYRISFVCLGNICRSPMADIVLNKRLRLLGLDEAVQVRSAGTGGWHVGKPIDERAASELVARDYNPDEHRAQHVDRKWVAEEDLLLVMDRSNFNDVRLLCGNSVDSRDRVLMFRDFDPMGLGQDVPDPYYGHRDGFWRVLDIVERTTAVLATLLADKFKRPDPPEGDTEGSGEGSGDGSGQAGGGAGGGDDDALAALRAAAEADLRAAAEAAKAEAPEQTPSTHD